MAWRDITVRKRAEEALRASHERLKKVLEVETVGVMFWDLATGRMTDANDTFLKMMGYSRSEVEAGELTWQKLRRVLEKTKLTPSQLQYRKRKGKCRTSDYRNGNPGTLGGQIANKLLSKAVDEFQPVVEGRLQKSLPTKKEARRMAHEGNGHSRAVKTKL